MCRLGLDQESVSLHNNWCRLDNAMRSGGRDRSKVPLIVLVRRVVAEKCRSAQQMKNEVEVGEHYLI